MKITTNSNDVETDDFTKIFRDRSSFDYISPETAYRLTTAKKIDEIEKHIKKLIEWSKSQPDCSDAEIQAFEKAITQIRLVFLRNK